MMHPFNKIATGLLIVVFIVSCKHAVNQKSQAWSELPGVTKLDILTQTDFVPTLENSIKNNKNIIYAPAFLFAWNKLSETLGGKIIVDDSNSNDFKLVTRSTSYQNSMVDSEYLAEVIVDNGEIVARAIFNKTLPFATKLEKAGTPMHFGKIKVAVFGMYHYDEAIIERSRILYYNNDNNFILKLMPRDNDHEILFVKGLGEVTDLAEAIKRTYALIRQGEKERNDQTIVWKYEITPVDIFSIPEIKFNVKTNYKEIEGQTLSTSGLKGLTILEASQRTGFILNENGAEVESEAMVKMAADSSDAPLEIIHPKKMIFDSPFYMIIKHVDITNPYFVMKVNNTELMKKEN